MEEERSKYCGGKKTQINDKFIPTSLFRGLIPLMSGRPRNRLVMMNLYFIRVFFLHNIYIFNNYSPKAK